MKSTLLDFTDPISPPRSSGMHLVADTRIDSTPRCNSRPPQSTVCGRPLQVSNNFRLNARVAVSEEPFRTAVHGRTKTDGITMVIDRTADVVPQRSFIIFVT